MADSTELRLILNAIDKASGPVGNVNKQVGLLGKASKGAGDFVSSLGINFNALVNPAMLAGQAVSMVSKFVADSARETTAYNKQIREMTQVLGLGAEETSRIVQVADDWGIKIEDVRNALGMMNKNGVMPSIDNLAALADEYVNTADKSVFAEKASKLLGKQYQTLIPILAGGGAALREQAAAVDESLISTEKSIAASREYEVVMDTLGDTITGVSRTLGNELIPELTKGLNVINDSIVSTMGFGRSQEELDKAQKSGLITLRENNKLEYELRWNRKTSTEVTEILKQKYEDLWGSIGRTTDAGERHRDMLQQGLIPATDDMTQSAEELAKALQTELNQQMSDLNSFINGRLGPSLDDFVEKQKDVQKALAETDDKYDEQIVKMGEVQGKIDELNAKSYLTEAQKEDLEELKKKHTEMGEDLAGIGQDYKDLEDQYGKNADAHDEATKRILFDMIVQRGAAMEMTNEQRREFNTMVTGIVKDWGLIDQASFDAYTAADQSLQNLVNGVGVTQTKIVLENQLGMLTNIKSVIDYLSGKTFEYAVKGEYTISGQPIGPAAERYTPPPKPKVSNQNARASGGPVYPGQSYTVGEQGPETLVMGREGGGMVYNNTWNVYTNAGKTPYQRDYNMQKARAH